MSATGPLLFRQLITVVAVLVLALPAMADVITSETDRRQYLDLVLENGLKVLLVSDPETDKAAASLDVHVGSGSDPDDREGLAHFLEHMLFLGTESYPTAGDYQAFITRHGGTDNAATSNAHTTYYFDINAGQLDAALDRFSEFFNRPLLDPEYVERERAVVHSELTSKLKEDGRRLLAARRQAFDPRHPRAGFAIGNQTTLADRAGDAVRDDLLVFYNRFYRAGNMGLAVLGREPLDVLERWVTERFDSLPAGADAPGVLEVSLYSPATLPLLQHVVPMREMRYAQFVFPVTSPLVHYREKPLAYLGHLLGHEGPRSLLSILKARGWAEGLSAGAGLVDEADGTFEVAISLTQAGLRHYREVGELLFSAIRLIGRKGLQTWIYDEQKRLAKVDFRYRENVPPLPLVLALSQRLHDYPAEDLLYAPYRYDRFDRRLIAEYLTQLAPENLHLILVGPELETNAIEPTYQVPYRLETLPETDLSAWSQPRNTPELGLPQPNPFIPEDLSLQHGADSGDVPERIEIADGFTLWFRNDTSFGFPKGNAYISVRSPIAGDSPRHAVLTQFYIASVLDQVNAVSYPALLAGLGFDVYHHSRGFTIMLKGYSDRQHGLLSIILSALKQPDITPARFRRVRQKLLRSLRNDARQNPAGRIISDHQRLLRVPAWWPAEMIDVTEPLGVQDLQDFVPRFLGRGHAVALMHGNYGRDEAIAMAQSVKEVLLAQTRFEPLVRYGQILKLRDGEAIGFRTAADHSDTALMVYLQGGSKRLDERSSYGLLSQMLETPFYQRLRTEQKLGYLVHAGSLSIRQVPGLVFMVQSPDRTPAELFDAIKEFFNQFQIDLAGMTELRFMEFQESLLKQIQVPDQRLDDRSARYWYEINQKSIDFDRREKLAQAVRALTLESIRRFYQDAVLSDRRRMMVVWTTGAGAAAAGGGSLPGLTEVDTPVAFRAGRLFFH